MVDDVALQRLRELVKRLRQSGSGVDKAALIALVEELQLDAGLTIDLDAVAELGQPVVVVQPRPKQAGSDPIFAGLTPREREVAGLVAAGLRNADVALALGISLGTVKDHVHRILVKTGLDGRTGIAATW